MTVSKKDARALLKKGGQRIHQQATAEIYDRVGSKADGSHKLERQTGAGMEAHVHQLLDPKLVVTDNQRAVGNCFGAFYEMAMSGGTSEFLREYVDGGKAGSGGFSEAQTYRIMMVGTALDALKDAKPFTYPRGKPRNCVMGRHIPIKPFRLAYAVCVGQRTLSSMALTYEWTRIPIENGKWGRAKVPDRQRKAIAQALRDTLDIIDEAWEEGGYSVPYEFFTVVTR